MIESVEQLSLYKDDTKRHEHEELALTVDRLRDRYGYNAVLNGISISDATLPVIIPYAARQRGAGLYELTTQR